MADPTTEELILRKQRADEAARQAAAHNSAIYGTRGEGLRVQLSRIRGVTKGDAAKVLKTPYRFQCAPLDSFSIPRSRSFNRYTNYRGKEYLSRSGEQLQVITFRTIAVEWGNFVIERYFDVEEIVERLARIHAAGWPFDLLATHRYNRKPELHVRAVLESFTTSEQAGEQDARYIDLNFTEWDDPVVSVRGRGRVGTAHTWPKWLTLDRGGFAWGAEGITVPSSVARNLDAKEWTFATLAKYAYGKPSLADHIAAAQTPPIKIRGAGAPGGSGWGAHSPIMQHKLYRKGGKIKVPPPPPQIKLPTGMGTSTFGVSTPPGI